MNVVMDDFNATGDYYGVEKFWAYLKYRKDCVDVDGIIRKDLKEVVEKVGGIEGFRKVRKERDY